MNGLRGLLDYACARIENPNKTTVHLLEV